MATIPGTKQHFLFDLDGTVYRGGAAVPGAPAFFQELARRGHAVRFITNRSNRTPEAIAAHLSGLGVGCTPEQVITSAHAAAAFGAGRTVYCIGEEGLQHALERAGARLTAAAPELVIVGFDRGFDFAKLTLAARLVRGGARLVATNPDPFINSDEGIIPENGAIVAAIEAAAGTPAIVLGKPEPFMVELALRELGADPASAIIIGDNPDTDIACGVRAGVDTALILTGVTSAADVPAASHRPTYVVEGYDTLTELFLR